MRDLNVLEWRRRCVEAWQTRPAHGRKLLPNPLQECKWEGSQSSQHVEIDGDFSAEIAAWESASDEDFEEFENSLEG